MKKKFVIPFFCFFLMSMLSGCSNECQHKSIVIDSAASATCVSHGLTEGSHCEKCGEVLIPQEIIEPLGHDVIIDEAIAATCIEDGKTVGAHCERCKDIIIPQIVVGHIGHNLKTDEAIAPTCTSHGLSEGSHCETCGEVLIPQEIIEPLGHDVVIDNELQATCTEDGKTAGAHCARCKEIIVAQTIIEHHGHKTVIDSAIAPTCTSHGLSEGSHCETCGEIFVKQQIIEPLGHNPVIDEAIAPTCTEDGKTAGVHCSRCNEVLVSQELLNHPGHKIVIDEAIAPTCTGHGLTEGSHCETCGEVLNPQYVVEPLGHDPVIDEAVSATCTNDGLTAGVHCSRCNEILVSQNVIEHQGHNIVVDIAVAPTCTSHGLSEGSHCETCGEVLIPQEIIEPLGHDVVIDNELQATCTEDGKTAGAHCTRCNEVLIEQEIIGHTGHNVVNDSAIEPTCTNYGLTAGSHCETCGEILVAQQPIEPLGHDFAIDNPVESTCSEEGKTLGLHCARCNSVFIEQECVTKKPHTKGNLIDISVIGIPNVTNPGLFECSICHQNYYDSIKHEDIDIPVLSINGDLTGISKDNKKNIFASYEDDNQSLELNATLKLQGASSIGYPKKNYNIQFFKDDTFSSKLKVKLVDSWGKQNKYTLKANWVDFSEMRNVVSGKIYGDIVHSRDINDQFDALPNGGAIDGYAILLFQNGSYQGLYTLNTSKDDYLFGMSGGEESREALLMVNNWSDTGRLLEHIPEDFGETWELEYASTEDNEEIGTSWVVDSFNTMIDFVNNNDGQDFIDGISDYINVPRAIDSMLYTWAIHANDNTSKNILWATYDGVHWTPSVYDMDGTWGCYWNGDMTTVNTNAWKPHTGNALWAKIFNNMQNEVVERWNQLRQGPLSIQNIDQHFVDFYKTIPSKLYECERQKWEAVPSQYTNHVTQIVNWATEYLHNMDISMGLDLNEQAGYKISIETDEHIQVRAYLSSDYSHDPNLTSIVYSRDSDTGLLTTSGGQFNFLVVVDEGYEVDSISITGPYNKIKYPSDTGVDNVYRITKIDGDLIINISAKSIQ